MNAKMLIWFIVLWLFSCFVCAAMDWNVYATIPMIAIPFLLIALARDASEVQK